jgi:hypothetical protein
VKPRGESLDAGISQKHGVSERLIAMLDENARLLKQIKELEEAATRSKKDHNEKVETLILQLEESTSIIQTLNFKQEQLN